MSLAKVENNIELFDEKSVGHEKWKPTMKEMKEIAVFQKSIPEMGWLMAETIYMYNKLYPQKVMEYNKMSSKERLIAYPLREELKYKNGKITTITDAIEILDGKFIPDYDKLVKPCEPGETPEQIEEE